MGCRLWGHTEADTTEATWQQQQQQTYNESIFKTQVKNNKTHHCLIILLPFTTVFAPEVIDIYCVCIVEMPQDGVRASVPNCTVQ